MKVHREYLDINKKWGWIHVSTSPAGAPLHFVNKKDGGLWEYVRTILTRVQDMGLTMKASKCEFHTTETEYLWYVISLQLEGVRMNEGKIRTIKEWK